MEELLPDRYADGLSGGIDHRHQPLLECVRLPATLETSLPFLLESLQLVEKLPGSLGAFVGEMIILHANDLDVPVSFFKRGWTNDSCALWVEWSVFV